MNRTFNFICSFAKAALIAFILIGSALSAIMLPLLGSSGATLAFVGAVTAFLSVIIGVQEACGFHGEAVQPVSRAQKLYTPLGAITMSFIGSAVATFALNIAFWSLYLAGTGESEVVEIILDNLVRVTLFSLLVGLVAATARAVSIAVITARENA